MSVSDACSFGLSLVLSHMQSCSDILLFPLAYISTLVYCLEDWLLLIVQNLFSWSDPLL